MPSSIDHTKIQLVYPMVQVLRDAVDATQLAVQVLFSKIVYCIQSSEKIELLRKIVIVTVKGGEQ